MKIIAIEGLDKSGKATQTRLLAARLRLDSYNVVQSEFHRYDTPTGELIMKWLKKEYDVDQKTIELIMAADKQAQQAWFKDLAKQGVDILILDRYTLSQRVYGQATGSSQEWINILHDHMHCPDVDIVIDIPAEVSMARKGKHNDGQNDRYESDLNLLRQVRDLYQIDQWSSDPPRYFIDGEQSIEQIHEDIYARLTNRERGILYDRSGTKH